MSDAWLMYLAVASLLAIAGGALVLAWTRGRLGIASAVVFVLSLAVWVADFAAVTSGYRDADGFVDCLDACTGVHLAAGLGFIVPPLLISVSAAGMIVALVARRRRRVGR
ncbi:MAG: hypothetical protein ACRDNY_01375 [Gaiellaceae bacterium]